MSFFIKTKILWLLSRSWEQFNIKFKNLDFESVLLHSDPNSGTYILFKQNHLIVLCHRILFYEMEVDSNVAISEGCLRNKIMPMEIHRIEPDSICLERIHYHFIIDYYIILFISLHPNHGFSLHRFDTSVTTSSFFLLC